METKPLLPITIPHLSKDEKGPCYPSSNIARLLKDGNVAFTPTNRMTEWELANLVEALRKWTERNPCKRQSGGMCEDNRHENSVRTKQREWKQCPCICCEKADHKPTECKQVVELAECKAVIERKKFCYNCTRANHRASECYSKGRCTPCKAKHHSSMCDKRMTASTSDQIMARSEEASVVYPVVVAIVNGVRCLACLA